MKILLGVFILLHGLIHLMYFGHAARYFEMKPGMLWPDGSWIFSRFLVEAAVRNLASISLILAAVGLVIGGIGIFAGLAWWRPLVVAAAVFSSLVYLLFWNGKLQNLDGQGGIGILINIAILLVVLVLRWPK